MRVMGIDLSTRAVDVVTVPTNETQPEWWRFPLHGADAFDRTRSVREAMPPRSSIIYDDVLAIGIEHPAGHHGTRDLLRVQGAILACLPPHVLVHPLPPSSWRKLSGLKGNATKQQVAAHSYTLRCPPEWPQDAHDAHLIARATIALLDKQAQP